MDHRPQVQSYNRVQPVQLAQSEGEEIKIHKRVNWLPLGNVSKKGLVKDMCQKNIQKPGISKR